HLSLSTKDVRITNALLDMLKTSRSESD
ncbi:hypothetical protein KIPB_016430, partial [Kipferlia bialata]